ncbi:MAG: hypothetical protein KatS3mg059_1782 [Thermomicrobiales bacterium]|nr:MAG: hypothetical protein KatS3mg059_1782 [Thermomicrobiales bacterium]
MKLTLYPHCGAVAWERKEEHRLLLDMVNACPPLYRWSEQQPDGSAGTLYAGYGALLWLVWVARVARLRPEYVYQDATDQRIIDIGNHRLTWAEVGPYRWARVYVQNGERKDVLIIPNSTLALSVRGWETYGLTALDAIGIATIDNVPKEDLRTAFRWMAQLYHPDRAGEQYRELCVGVISAFAALTECKNETTPASRMPACIMVEAIRRGQQWLAWRIYD